MKVHTRAQLYFRYGLKTGVAGTMAYLISWWMGSPYAVWAVVSAVIAMQVNVADSIQAGLARAGGTVLGAAVGIILLVLVPETELAAGIAVFLLCTGFGFLAFYNAKGASNAGVAANIVLLMGMAAGHTAFADAAFFGIMRMAEIIIGVGSAFLVSLWVWPNRLMDTLRMDLSMQLNECARMLDMLVDSILNSQQNVSEESLIAVEERIWDNHERLTRAKKHESVLFRYEHTVMNIQVAAMDRTIESLRTITDALNDYEEEGMDLLLGAELRALADALILALRHLGGPAPQAHAPEVIRAVTTAAGNAEVRLADLRLQKLTNTLPLHKILQLYTFYQAMRQLAESLLLSMDRIQQHKSLFHSNRT